MNVSSPIAEHIWDSKYRFKDGGVVCDQTLDETWARIARAAAGIERGTTRKAWEDRFHAAMSDLAFLPAGRIIAGAGTGRQVTLFNCFVMDTIKDDMGSIFANVREAALTMQQGGGIGHDFSTLRPQGAPVRGVGADASGPVSFMDVWDAMCRTILSAGQRRGAMMGTMRCDHPDIEQFIDAKADANRLRMFNLSVLITDPFMAAVEADADWPLIFDGTTYRTIKARALWSKIMRATYDYAEPGVIFIDRINAANNLQYCESIHCTNPCGEQPLPPYGACLLGSLNLTRFVRQPFSTAAELDSARLEEIAAVAVRLLDNVIDISGYPLEAQRREAFAKRRLGLGITGLADALVMCGLDYRTPAARDTAGSWMRAIQNAAYRASAKIAAERGSFPLYDAKKMVNRPGIERLDTETRDTIARNGLRNGLVTSIAPTGTISLLAGNVSSGIEPIFDLTYQRKLLRADGSSDVVTIDDYAYRLYRTEHGTDAALPAAFVTANALTPTEHLGMQAALQPFVDSSISKTINCPESIPFDAFADIYREAYRLGLKGCTTFRPNAVTGSVLSVAPPPPPTASTGALTTSSPSTAVAVSSSHVSADTMPLPRDPVLAGYTYKLRWPESDHALYVTINDVTVDGRQRPFEIFINSKNLEHYAWTVALTRMISAVFRRGGDVGFVVEELKAVFDPRGGHWLGGRYVPSLLAAIGEIIEAHMIAIGFLPAPERGSIAPKSAGSAAHVPFAPMAGAAVASAADAPGSRGAFCPRCNQPVLTFMEGCWTCRACGYSHCS